LSNPLEQYMGYSVPVDPVSLEYFIFVAILVVFYKIDVFLCMLILEFKNNVHLNRL